MGKGDDTLLRMNLDAFNAGAEKVLPESPNLRRKALCDAKAPRSTATCVKPYGHDGPHEAQEYLGVAPLLWADPGPTEVLCACGHGIHQHGGVCRRCPCTRFSQPLPSQEPFR
jgi:hypothetical protein